LSSFVAWVIDSGRHSGVSWAEIGLAENRKDVGDGNKTASPQKEETGRLAICLPQNHENT